MANSDPEILVVGAGFGGLAVVRGLADHLHVGLAVEDHLEPFADCLVIVGEENAKLAHRGDHRLIRMQPARPSTAS